jgi:hypothetical protein
LIALQEPPVLRLRGQFGGQNKAQPAFSLS